MMSTSCLSFLLVLFVLANAIEDWQKFKVLKSKEIKASFKYNKSIHQFNENLTFLSSCTIILDNAVRYII